jgi:hypothetical protein
MFILNYLYRKSFLILTYILRNIIIILKNVRGSPLSILLAFSQFYKEYDLRKNKIIVASKPVFLGINIKFEVLAPKLSH